MSDTISQKANATGNGKRQPNLEEKRRKMIRLMALIVVLISVLVFFFVIQK